ncbi:MAG: BMP family ABC transporter substrate-binding protein [Aggregatilineales bacterium]
MIKRRIVVGLLLVCSIFVFAFGGVAAQDTVQSVCLITDIGRVNDGTFNEFAYDGMVRAVEEFGLESTFIETQNVADYATNISTCVEGDWNIIITVGFSLGDAAYASAVENPDIFFIGIDQDFSGVDPLPNLVGLQFREDQAGFLAGAMAALMSESDVVAGVYGLDIFPVIKFRNGFEQGALYINPDISTLGVYIPDFQAPDRGQEAAAQFIGEGADVIFGAGGPTGSGGIAYAANQGVYVIGVDQDEYFTTFGGGESPGAENLITSAIKRVDNGVYDMIAAVVEGDGFPSDSTYVLSLFNDGIDFAEAHDSDVSQEVIDLVSEIKVGLTDGSIVTGVHPITGEMLDDIVTVADGAGSFTTLLAAAEAAGLAETLATGGPFTVFAPTDEAFAAALDALGMTAEEVLADTETLTSILLYHVVENAVGAEVVVNLDGVSVPTLNGESVTISVTEDGVMVNDANVILADVHASNGIIHVIDAVLIPMMGE